MPSAQYVENNDLFFHFSAPAGQSWAGFGFGDGMNEALIFVVYASADGKNVTVSPRLGSGHNMPSYTDAVKVNVLSGSGIVDDNLVVNAQCQNCREWNEGKNKLDLTSTSAKMIWAVGPADTLQTDDKSARISQHGYNSMGVFSLNLKDATGAAGVPTNITSPVTADEDEDEDEDGSGMTNRGVAVHALLMVGAFLIIFPAGYLFLRVFEKVWLHAGIQWFGMVLVAVGTAAGVALSIRQKMVHPFTSSL